MSNESPGNQDEYDEDIVPRVVILGAGPIGLEAALYARYLGYEVAVFEKGRVAANVLRWGHVRMFSPFSMNRSTLGAAALRAQDENFELPPDDSLLTGGEFANRYLIPLSNSDLLVNCIHENVEVLSIGRDGILKTDVRDVNRGEFRFRVLVRTPEGEDVVDSDVVIDTTGVTNQTNHLGHGGMAALGESECCHLFCDPHPDILGDDRSKFAGKRVLVVGSGYSAATNIVALAEVQKEFGATEVTWVTRRDCPPSGPLPVAANDRLPSRSELAALANSASCEHFDQTSVLALRYDEAKQEFDVTFGGKLTGECQFDQVIANVGFRPNLWVQRELQMSICPAIEAPQGVATWLHELGPVDCLDQESPGASALSNPEPNFFVLGSKSFGRNSNFLLKLGLDQIRDVFTQIAGREDLDLYKTMASLA